MDVKSGITKHAKSVGVPPFHAADRPAVEKLRSEVNVR